MACHICTSAKMLQLQIQVMDFPHKKTHTFYNIMFKLFNFFRVSTSLNIYGGFPIKLGEMNQKPSGSKCLLAHVVHSASLNLLSGGRWEVGWLIG